MNHIPDFGCSEPWQFGPERKVKPVNRREQIARERELREFITANRFTKKAGFTCLRTPEELARVAKAQGINASVNEIELAAARGLIAVGS